MSSAFTNLYYKRAVGTPKPCYVCRKPTTTVLATINTVDFIYTCDTHLSDPGFASPVGSAGDGVGAGGAKMGLGAEEIAKVKAEWEERQRQKAEKAKEKEKDKDKDGKDDEKDKEKKSSADEKKSPPPGAWSPSPITSPAPSTPQQARYTLHRDMFALRLAEHRRRRQAAQAKDLAPRLPGAPRTALPPPT